MKIKKKKAVKIAVITVPIFILAVLIGAYIIYGLTLVNPHSEKSLNNFLAIDKNYPIEILATAEYEDYYAVLYKDPLNPNTNAGNAYFRCFEKNKYYLNRYNRRGGSLGMATYVNVHSYKPDDERGLVFIYCDACNGTKCVVTEYDFYTDEYVKQLDEFEVPTTAFIIVKEYELDAAENDISVWGGYIDINTGEIVYE